MFFRNMKFRKEIETLIFVRNLSSIVIGAICWQMTGSKKIENLNLYRVLNCVIHYPLSKCQCVSMSIYIISQIQRNTIQCSINTPV